MSHNVTWVSGTSAMTLPSHSHTSMMVLDSRGVSTGDTVYLNTASDYMSPSGSYLDKRDVIISFYINRLKKEFLQDEE